MLLLSQSKSVSPTLRGGYLNRKELMKNENNNMNIVLYKSIGLGQLMNQDQYNCNLCNREDAIQKQDLMKKIAFWSKQDAVQSNIYNLREDASRKQIKILNDATKRALKDVDKQRGEAPPDYIAEFFKWCKLVKIYQGGIELMPFTPDPKKEKI